MGKEQVYSFDKSVSPSAISVEEAIQQRRSVREFKRDKLSFDDLGKLLWSALGFQNLSRGRRTAPSAGACYPLSAYVAIGTDSIEGVKEGVYFYSYQDHSLKKYLDGDLRLELSKAALHQEFIAVAPVSIIFVAIMSLTTSSYGERGIRYVYIDLGHAAQNIYLQATAMGLGTVAVGAYQDSKVAEILSLSKEESPLYIMPIGLPK